MTRNREESSGVLRGQLCRWVLLGVLLERTSGPTCKARVPSSNNCLAVILSVPTFGVVACLSLRYQGLSKVELWQLAVLQSHESHQTRALLFDNAWPRTSVDVFIFPWYSFIEADGTSDARISTVE